MTGLDLESFLELLRADVGAWVSLGLVVLLAALMAWTSWGSRRALRKCLVLSIGAHFGLLLYGSTLPAVNALLEGDVLRRDDETATRRVSVAPVVEGERGKGQAKAAGRGRDGAAGAPWDQAPDAMLANAPRAVDLRPPSIRPDRTDPPAPMLPKAPPATATAELSTALPEPAPPAPTEAAKVPTPAAIASADPVDVAKPSNAPGASGPETPFAAGRVRPDRIGPLASAAPSIPRPAAPGLPSLTNAPDLGGGGGIPEMGPRRTTDLPGSASPSESSTEIPTARPLVPGSASSSATDPLANRDLRGRARTGAGTARPTDAVRPTTRPALPAAGAGAMPDLNQPSLTAAPPTGVTRGLASPPTDPVAGPSLDPSRPSVAAPSPVKPANGPTETLPGADLRRSARPTRSPGENGTMIAARTPLDRSAPLALNRVSPDGAGALPDIQGAVGLTRPLSDIPSVYRSRLDPNRTVLAQRSGATRDSEQAVERALDWLSKHQDADGRWDGGTARYKDGTVAEGDDDYMVHCPPGDLCYGPCYYWEADTALTGLALLSFLGSGYTHTDGKYAETVGKGLDYLRMQQKPDGDLRGRSVAVGMYCHAMATLALCEAYALTGDPKLRVPVERAVAFIGRSRAKDRLAWRYAPGAEIGDTSILGWVVMVLKSAKEVGIVTPPDVRQGISTWLARVSTGPSNGLAKYQPWEKVTPTMTAEAWVCRRFLDLGATPALGNEAAAYLLDNGPSKGQPNFYYWYYGTLAMFQHGGDTWNRWNGEVRDALVKSQRSNGHASGSWDPDPSQYGTHGGRIYCTALATLTLEVYYRYILK